MVHDFPDARRITASRMSTPVPGLHLGDRQSEARRAVEAVERSIFIGKEDAVFVTRGEY